MADTHSLVRIGIVSSVDGSSKKARVYFPDMTDMVSGWLSVLQHPHQAVSATDDVTVTLGDWMPAVNERVLCLYAHGFGADGFILGVIP